MGPRVRARRTSRPALRLMAMAPSSIPRAILYAYRQETYRAFGEERFPEAARAAVLAMKEELAAVLGPLS